MGRLFLQELSGPKIFQCKCCRVDSASHDDIVSKHFQGRFGVAYLFLQVVNVCLGPGEDRYLLSGLHTVNDITVFLAIRYSAGDMRRRLRKARSTKKACTFLKRSGC